MEIDIFTLYFVWFRHDSRLLHSMACVILRYGKAQEHRSNALVRQQTESINCKWQNKCKHVFHLFSPVSKRQEKDKSNGQPLNNKTDFQTETSPANLFSCETSFWKLPSCFQQVSLQPRFLETPKTWVIRKDHSRTQQGFFDLLGHK